MKRENISSLVDKMIANIHYSTVHLIGSTGNNVLVQKHIGSLCFILNPGPSESYRVVIVEPCGSDMRHHEITKHDTEKEYIFVKGYSGGEGLEIYKKPPLTIVKSYTGKNDDFSYLYNVGHHSPEDDDKAFVVGSMLFGAEYLFAVLRKINVIK